ncbi:MAG: GNAT family N-acetyltransferase [Saprospiraceae bacterium]|nr:GNAT family N-acetyltransferase [Saprospiraceae bacterium]
MKELSRKGCISFSIPEEHKKRILCAGEPSILLVCFCKPQLTELLASYLSTQAFPLHRTVDASFLFQSALESRSEQAEWQPNFANDAGKNKGAGIIYYCIVDDSGALSYMRWKHSQYFSRGFHQFICRFAEIKIPLILAKIVPTRSAEKSGVYFPYSAELKNMLRPAPGTYQLQCSHHIQSESLLKPNHGHSPGSYLYSRLQLLGSAHRDKTVYSLQRQVKAKTSKLNVIGALQQSSLIDEIAALPPDHCLVDDGHFRVYLSSPERMKLLLLEIGRLRELTFRENLEGTGFSVDLDPYDDYYKHLFVWDCHQQKIAGAYRIGEGQKICSQLGISGFYISSLFNVHPSMGSIMGQTIELGRSFVIPEYQRAGLVLMLLWQGLYKYLRESPGYKYVMGPVSISCRYSRMSRLMMVSFLSKYYLHPAFSKLIRPKKPFRHLLKVQTTKRVASHSTNDLRELDKILTEIENHCVRLPVMLRQYLRQNAKIIAFNRDPSFMNVLDALVILEIEDEVTDLQRYLAARILRGGGN